MRAIVATRNKNKFKEIKNILKGVKGTIISLYELADEVKIKETGKTFFENALRKAVTVSKKYPCDLVIGEDSGLEVVSLGGTPGVFSKRYSGKNASDGKIT